MASWGKIIVKRQGATVTRFNAWRLEYGTELRETTPMVLPLGAVGGAVFGNTPSVDGLLLLTGVLTSISGSVFARLPTASGSVVSQFSGQVFGLRPIGSGDLSVLTAGSVFGCLPSVSGQILGFAAGQVAGFAPTVSGNFNATVFVAGTVYGLLPTVFGAVGEAGAGQLNGQIVGLLPIASGGLNSSTSGSTIGLLPVTSGNVNSVITGGINGSLSTVAGIVNAAMLGNVDGLLPTASGTIIGAGQVNGQVFGLLPVASGQVSTQTAGQVSGNLPSTNGNAATLMSGQVSGLLPVVNGTIDSGASEDPVVTDWVDRTVAAGGSVALSTRDAMDTFVKGCKTDGIWSVMSQGVILPFASDAFAGCFVPLVAPSGAVFTNNNFVSADYSLATGLDPGASNSTKCLTSNLAANTVCLSNSTQVSTYQRILRSGSNTVFSVDSNANTASSRITLHGNFSGIDYWDTFNATGGQGRISVATGLAGLLTGMRINSLTIIARRGSQIVTGTQTGGTLPTQNIRLFANNNISGVPTSFDKNVNSYIYFGRALMNMTQELQHHNRVQALQAALGRAV